MKQIDCTYYPDGSMGKNKDTRMDLLHQIDGNKVLTRKKGETGLVTYEVEGKLVLLLDEALENFKRRLRPHLNRAFVEIHKVEMI